MKNSTTEHPQKITKKLIILSLLFAMGCIVEYFGFQDHKDIVFKATEDNAIDYKVFLKPNEFFSEPYLGPGKTYITSLIDHIDIDFKHAEAFSENASGSISYYLQATISADKTSGTTGDGTYWSKEYRLTEPTTMGFEDTNQIDFSASTSINYSHYNSILESFREQYPVASEGTIKISLVVSDAINAENFNDPLGFKSESSLSLPLLERAVEAKVDVDTGVKDQEFKSSQKTNEILFLAIKVFGAVLILVSIILTIIGIIKRRNFIKNNQYISLLDKILETNDSIITNIENLPSFAKFQKFEVKSFEELLDAYNEVRLPINFYQNKAGTESTFFIANENIVWIYRLKKRNLGS